MAPPPGVEHIHNFRELYGDKESSDWKICGSCGFVHQNPRPTIAALNEIYLKFQCHARKIDDDSKQHLRFARWYFSEKVDFAIKHSAVVNGAVFDVGCGRGGVHKLYEERGWRAFGVEQDGNLADFAINKLGLQGVRQGLFNSQFELGQRVDLVVTNHAFEHFAELGEVMKGVEKILKPGGHLFTVVPTYMKNKSSLSKRWMNSSHYSLFTHHSLNNLLAQYGFEEVTHTYAGWNKEVDDLWHLAVYLGPLDANQHFEKPERVSRYLRFINPFRSFMFYPIYSHWATRVRLVTVGKLLFDSPREFVRKVMARVKRRNAVSASRFFMNSWGQVQEPLA